jgi:hypothetical protein
LRVFAGETFKSVFKDDTLPTRWLSFLDKIDTQSQKILTLELYSYKGVLQEICPHSRADTAYPFTASDLNKLRQQTPMPPMPLQKAIQAQKPPYDDNKLARWQEDLKTLLTPDLSFEQITIKVRLTQLYFLQHHQPNPTWLDELRQIQASHQLGGTGRLISVNESLQKQEDPLPWIHYLLGWGPIPPNPQGFVQHYLTLRAKPNFQALASLSSANPALQLEWLDSLANQAFHQNNFTLASVFWEQAAQISDDAPGYFKLQSHLARNLGKQDLFK